MFWAALVVVAVGGAGAGFAAQGDSAKGGSAAGTPDWSNRIGVGVNLGRVDARYAIDSLNAVDVFVDLDVGSGDALFEGTMFGTGGYYLRRLVEADPVGAHVLAGLSIGYDDVGGTESTDFAVFGGFGAEYFFPGTDKFSIEASIGLGAHFLSSDTSGVSNAGVRVRIDDLTSGLLMLRYYFR